MYHEGTARAQSAPRDAPEYFSDLNLDQIVAAITTGKDVYDLKPFFYDVLKTREAISYRHEVMHDLEDRALLDHIKAFARSMAEMRDKLDQASKLHYKHQTDRWSLHAIDVYCAAIRDLDAALSQLTIASCALVAFREYVRRYAASEAFSSLSAQARAIADELAGIQYEVLIAGNGFKVRRYAGERDYSVEVLEAFKKFQQADATDHRVRFAERIEMNHVEGQILEFVAFLNRDTFARLGHFVSANANYADPILVTFDREVQFYISYLDFIATFQRAGLSFCYPDVSTSKKSVYGEDAFDLALAIKLATASSPIVCNDVALTAAERILVISGPNQGGKTTFARMFGQLHHLASIGCLVPGRSAKLFLFDSMYTHFEREENIHNLRGKLQDDLIRIHDILDRATLQSILILNEIFNSTTLRDAVFLARKVIDRVTELDALCVCVTFLDELSTLNEKTVSMVSTVVPDDPAQRTYKVLRRAADGRSYAISIAEKYRVTYQSLLDRIPSDDA